MDVGRLSKSHSTKYPSWTQRRKDYFDLDFAVLLKSTQSAHGMSVSQHLIVSGEVLAVTATRRVREANHPENGGLRTKSNHRELTAVLYLFA